MKLYKRNKMWYMDERIQGKRLRKSLSANKSIAQEMAEGYILDILQNKPTVLKQHAFINEVNRFMFRYYNIKNAFNGRHKSQGNASHALSSLKRLYKTISKEYVDEYRVSDIEGYIANLQDTMKNKQINRHIVHFRRFFEYCVKNEKVKTNIALRVDRLKEEIHAPYSFKKEEINLILSKAGVFHNFFVFLLETGLRAADAWDLTKKQFIREVNTANYSPKKDGMYMRVWMHKPEKWVTVPVNETVQKIVESSGEILFFWAKLKTARRTPLKYINEVLGKDYCKKNKVSPHSFRHTYAKKKLRKGMPKDILQQFLGHSSVKTTEIYANEVPKEVLREFI